MSIENHIALIFASLAWSISASLSLFIFWPFVAVVSIGVGFLVAKLLKNTALKKFALNGLASSILGMLVVFIFGSTGYTQPEWQAMLYLVVFVNILSFYFGGLVYVWSFRARSHT